jgi:hypothetical protein
MYHQFNIQQFYVLPTQCIYVFCMDLRTAIISLYSFNRLVCISEMKCVYCAVRTGSLYVIQVNISLSGVKEEGERFSVSSYHFHRYHFK